MPCSQKVWAWRALKAVCDPHGYSSGQIRPILALSHFLSQEKNHTHRTLHEGRSGEEPVVLTIVCFPRTFVFFERQGPRR